MSTLNIEERMDEFEESQAEMLRLLHKLDQGIFGDEKIGYPGVIKTQAAQQLQIDDLKKQLEEIRKVNRDQDIAIGAKKEQDGTWIKWGKIALIFLGVFTLIWGMIAGYIKLADVFQIIK